MTQTEIAAPPDAELVRNVAERVMGWKSRGGCTHCVDDTADKFGRGPQWKPLTDWNHTMQVVAAMRAKGFVFGMIESSAKDHVDIAFSKWVDRKSTSPLVICERSNEQRAILEAALMAAGATDEPA